MSVAGVPFALEQTFEEYPRSQRSFWKTLEVAGENDVDDRF